MTKAKAPRSSRVQLPDGPLMIDHERKCIFLHIGRTGGTSVDFAFCGGVDDPDKHWVSSNYIKVVGRKTWREYFKFSFVRNPWDRMVSMYHYRRDVRCAIPKEMTFKGFVRWVHFDSNPWTQLRWFGIHLEEMDFIGRFENLHEDFKTVCERVGLVADLPHCEGTIHDHYTTYYDLETRQLVSDYYREDIEEFGYAFLN